MKNECPISRWHYQFVMYLIEHRKQPGHNRRWSLVSGKKTVTVIFIPINLCFPKKILLSINQNKSHLRPPTMLHIVDGSPIRNSPHAPPSTQPKESKWELNERTWSWVVNRAKFNRCWLILQKCVRLCAFVCVAGNMRRNWFSSVEKHIVATAHA